MWAACEPVVELDGLDGTGSEEGCSEAVCCVAMETSAVYDSVLEGLVGTITASVVPVTLGLVGTIMSVHILQNLRHVVSAILRYEGSVHSAVGSLSHSS